VSIDRRIGLAGIIVAFFGIAAFYLWPDKKWIGWTSLIGAVCLVLAWIVAEFYKTPENVDLWLGFDFNSWGPGNSALCIQSRGANPLFNVVASIGELRSYPIARLEPDGQPVSCSVTKAQVGDAAQDVALCETQKLRDIKRGADGRMQEASVPMEVTYTDRSGKSRTCGDFEVKLPFSMSSIKKRTKQSIFRRLRFSTQMGPERHTGES
jgi:hypothetical protein